MRYLRLFLTFLFIISNSTSAVLTSNKKLDSLLSELPKAEKDTNEVNLLAAISFNYRVFNIDKGFEYGQKGIVLARKIKWKTGEAKCLNSIGSNHFYKSNYDQAIKYYNKALLINEEIGNKHGLAMNLGNIALMNSYQSNFSQAVVYFKKAIKFHEELDEKEEVANDYINLGNTYHTQANYPKALESYLVALKVSEEINDKSMIAINLGNIGVIYVKQSKYSRALEYYKKTLKISEEIDDKSGIARNLGNIAIIYVEQKKYKKALEYYNTALAIDEKIGDKLGTANILGFMGALYTTTGKYDDSYVYLNRSLKVAIEIGQNFIIASRLSDIASNFNKMASRIEEIKGDGNKSLLFVNYKKADFYKKALQFGLRAEKIVDSLGLVERQYPVYYTLSESYENLNQPWKSLEYYKKYSLIFESIYNQENKEKINNLEQARQDERKEVKIEKQLLKITSQEREKKYIIFSSIGALLSVLVILGIIFNQRRKADKLLFNVLPVSIAKRLKNREHPISDLFDQASIIFIDIVNFTSLAKDADPERIVLALNKIFTHFDSIAEKNGLEKIKTIGDSYMAAAGIPVIQENNTQRAAQMALEVKDLMSNYHTSDGTKIEVRIGLDCGPVVAGVIGEKKYIYDMWSDSVNTASRMESTSLPGEIHITERFRVALSKFQEFEYLELNEVDIKGMGVMKTYFLGRKKA